MGDSPLPEDIANWPEDPYALLGIASDSDLVTTRRAYTKLVRKYKPEHYPAQFRRIRQAYEFILGQETRAAPSQQSSQPLNRPSTRPKPKSPEARPSSPVDGGTHAFSREQYADPWGLAFQGDIGNAYHCLCQLQIDKAHNAQIYPQLYWLLMGKPSLDSSRRPIDWLLKGIVQFPQHKPILSLFKSTLLDRSEALAEETWASLLCQFEGPLRLELLQLRWQKLALRDAWSLIGADIDHYRNAVSSANPDAWVDLICWVGGRCFRTGIFTEDALFLKCMQEMEDFDFLQTKQSAAFDRMEVLFYLASEWNPDIPRSIKRVLLPIIAGDYDQLQNAFEPLLNVAAKSPRNLIRRLDDLHDDTPYLFAELVAAVNWLAANMEVDSSDDAFDDSVCRLIELVTARRSYKASRARILLLCCREGITPEQLCRGLDFPGSVQEHLFEALQRDAPLHLAARVCHLAWA